MKKMRLLLAISVSVMAEFEDCKDSQEEDGKAQRDKSGSGVYFSEVHVFLG